MPVDRDDYFRQAAINKAASTKLYRVDAIVHVEYIDDIWFWRQILTKYRFKRYKFLPVTTNERGNSTTGCTQCLKYKDYLTQRFFICIDSDLRYLLDEDISVAQGILQTYTYSWENHCAFASRLQQLFAAKTGKGELFNFSVFLQAYSEIIYKPFLFMLYQEKHRQSTFNRDEFKKCISLQYAKGDESDNGVSLLTRLKNRMTEAIGDAISNSTFDFKKEADLYITKGVNADNVYLYVRGHCLYNCLLSLGKKLCNGTGVDFEHNILKTAFSGEEYSEMSKIQNDVCSLNNFRVRL